jgi:hypothetical protein
MTENKTAYWTPAHAVYYTPPDEKTNAYYIHYQTEPADTIAVDQVQDALYHTLTACLPDFKPGTYKIIAGSMNLTAAYRPMIHGRPSRRADLHVSAANWQPDHTAYTFVVSERNDLTGLKLVTERHWSERRTRILSRA